MDIQIVMGIFHPVWKNDYLWDICCVYLRDGDKSEKRETKRNGLRKKEKNKREERRQETGDQNEESRKEATGRDRERGRVRRRKQEG